MFLGNKEAKLEKEKHISEAQNQIRSSETLDSGGEKNE